MGHTIVLLTIDDDAALRRSVRGYFEDFDFKVLEAGDGETGLAILRDERPDVVLVDLRMPGLSGWRLSRRLPRSRLKFQSSSCRELVSSAMLSMQSEKELGFRNQAIADMAQLQHVVSMVLERARLRIESSRYREHLEEEVARRTLELAEINNRLKAIVQSTRSLAACSGMKEVSSRLLEEFASNWPLKEAVYIW